MAAPSNDSSQTVIPVLHKKRSKSAISVVIPHDPFTDNRDGVSPEDVRRITEEKIYWTNEARAWKDRAQELMAALREISEYVFLARPRITLCFSLPSRIPALLVASSAFLICAHVPFTFCTTLTLL